MSLLDVNDISVYRGEMQVLWDVSCKVTKGEFVAILGANGSGKTSLLQTVSGLLSPSKGSITFLGKKISGLPPHKIAEMGVVLVPEGRGIFPFMTVLENLEVGAYTKRARSKKDSTLKTVFELFPVLKERANQVALTLSGGEQQMLAIGRALMAQPILLMLDEPSLGLAPKVVESLYKTLTDINRMGVTILLADQNIHRALRVADRAYVLQNGRVMLEGDTRMLVENVALRAAYLGSEGESKNAN